VEALANVGQETDGGVAEGVGERLRVLWEVVFLCLVVDGLVEWPLWR